MTFIRLAELQAQFLTIAKFILVASYWQANLC
jgi:hypothetical protein